MTELDVILSRLDNMQEEQKRQGETLKDLTTAFSKMAVQHEQITSLQGQNSAIWRKLDDLLGPNGTITKIRDHQAHCPKEEMHRTFKWMWAALGVYSTILLFIIGALIKVAS